MPDEICFQTIRPQDHRPAGERDVLRMVRINLKLLGEISTLCQAAGFSGLEATTTTVQPGAASRELVRALEQGLALFDGGFSGPAGRPFREILKPESRKKVDDIISLTKLGLGLSLTKGPKVERINEERKPAPPLRPLPEEVQAAIYRPRPVE